MQTARSARRTQSPSRSAVEETATASIPRSWQARTMRTAASPRFAIRTRFSIAARSHRLELEERLSVLDRLGVVNQDAADDPGVVGLELVEQLHRLEDAERLADLDPVALVDERGLRGRRRAVERGHPRRLEP